MEHYGSLCLHRATYPETRAVPLLSKSTICANLLSIKTHLPGNLMLINLRAKCLWICTLLYIQRKTRYLLTDLWQQILLNFKALRPKRNKTRIEISSDSCPHNTILIPNSGTIQSPRSKSVIGAREYSWCWSPA